MELPTSNQRAAFILLPLLFALCSVRINGYTEFVVQPFTVKVVDVKEEADVTYLIGVKCHGSSQLETLRRSEHYGLEAYFSNLTCRYNTCFDVIVAKLRKNAENGFVIEQTKWDPEHLEKNLDGGVFYFSYGTAFVADSDFGLQNAKKNSGNETASSNIQENSGNETASSNIQVSPPSDNKHIYNVIVYCYYAPLEYEFITRAISDHVVVDSQKCPTKRYNVYVTKIHAFLPNKTKWMENVGIEEGGNFTFDFSGKTAKTLISNLAIHVTPTIHPPLSYTAIVTCDTYDKEGANGDSTICKSVDGSLLSCENIVCPDKNYKIKVFLKGKKTILMESNKDVYISGKQYHFDGPLRWFDVAAASNN